MSVEIKEARDAVQCAPFNTCSSHSESSIENDAVSALEVRGLSKHFSLKGGRVDVVHDLNLTVQSGTVFGLLGPNGAGKTTTIKMICGLIQPSAGEISLFGERFSPQENRHLVANIGALFEGSRNVHWRLSAWDNVMYFGRLKGVSGKALQERSERLLSGLKLWDRRHDVVGKFSRGMQQKVAIACALIADPDIIFLDEPTLGLDVQSALDLEVWMRDLVKNEGKTLLLSTHQLALAERICDRVAILQEGKLIYEETIEALRGKVRSDEYQISIEGDTETLRDGEWLARIEGLNTTGDLSQIAINFSNQVELHSFLGDCIGKGLKLIKVERKTATLEDVFVELTS